MIVIEQYMYLTYSFLIDASMDFLANKIPKESELLESEDIFGTAKIMALEENELFQKIEATFTQDPEIENPYFLKLQQLIIKNHCFIPTQEFEALHILSIVMKTIIESPTNSINAIICLDALICYFNIDHMKAAISFGLFDIIKSLLNKGGLEARAGFGYLANLSFYNELHEEILENIDISSIIPCVSFQNENYSAICALNVIKNLIPVLTSEFFFDFFNHLYELGINEIPTSFLCDILELLCVLHNLRADLEEIIKESSFFKSLLEVDIFPTEPISKEKSKRDELLIFLFLEYDVDFNSEDLLRLFSKTSDASTTVLILQTINRRIITDPEQIPFFISHGGIDLALHYFNEGNFNLKKESTLLLIALSTAFEDKSDIDFITPEIISSMIDFLEPDENDEFFIASVVGFLLSLINFDTDHNETNFINVIQENDILDHLSQLSSTQNITDYIESFVHRFEEITSGE